jgi:hypothetical protein
MKKHLYCGAERRAVALKQVSERHAELKSLHLFLLWSYSNMTGRKLDERRQAENVFQPKRHRQNR